MKNCNTKEQQTNRRSPLLGRPTVKSLASGRGMTSVTLVLAAAWS